jgi:hypothetical protein
LRSTKPCPVVKKPVITGINEVGSFDSTIGPALLDIDRPLSPESERSDTLGPMLEEVSSDKSQNNSANGKDIVWIQQYDPRSNQFYYINPLTGVVTYIKPRFVSKGPLDKKNSSAVSIQCAFRSKVSRNKVQHMKQIQSANRSIMGTGYGSMLGEAYSRKCKHITAMLQDIAEAIKIREMSSFECNSFPRLKELLNEFNEAKSILSTTFDSVESVIRESRDNQDLLSSKREELDTTLIQVQKGSSQLYRYIESKDPDFVALDVTRVNDAWKSFDAYRKKLLRISKNESLQKAVVKTEGYFRKVMGGPVFQAGLGLDAARMPTKVFHEWHSQVSLVMTNMEEFVQLFDEAAVPHDDDDDDEQRNNGVPERHVSTTTDAPNEDSAKEITSIQASFDALVLDPLAIDKPRCLYDNAYLQECWEKGLKMRDADTQRIAPQAENKSVPRRSLQMHLQYDDDDARAAHLDDQRRIHSHSVSIWEAVVEGSTICIR